MLSNIDSSVHTDSSQMDFNENNVKSPDTPKSFPIYICIKEYSKRMEDELDMKPGDKIQVITYDKEYNDGWYFGRNLRTKEEGLYPVVFTQAISTSRKSTLMRDESLKRANAVTAATDPKLTTPKGSTSTISTPLKLQNASLAPFSKFQNNQEIKKTGSKEIGNISTTPDATNKYAITRNISVKSAMSDIDKATEKLTSESIKSLNTANSNAEKIVESDIEKNTAITETEDLSIHGQSKRTEASFSEESRSEENVKDIQKSREYLTLKDVYTWSAEDVAHYFIDCGFDIQSALRFKKHKITGAILLELELSHLKELDIASFGTRFEIYKEIESLKENLSSGSRVKKTKEFNMLRESVPFSKELMPPAHVDKNNKPMLQPMVELSTSQSGEHTFSREKDNYHGKNLDKNRPISLMVNNQSTKNIKKGSVILPIKEELGNEYLFASPRIPPKPPSYPSPVQPSKSPMMVVRKVFTPKDNDRLEDSPSTLHQNKRESTITTATATTFKQTTDGKGKSVNSQVINNLRVPRNSPLAVPPSNKGIDQESTNSDMLTSSMYETSMSSISSIHPSAQSITTEDMDTRIYLQVEESPNNSSNKTRRKRSLLSYFKKGEESLNNDNNYNSVRKSNSFNLRRTDESVTSSIRQEFTENSIEMTPATKNSISSNTSVTRKDGKRSVGFKDPSTKFVDMNKEVLEDKKKKKSASGAMKKKALHAMTMRTPLKKQNTTAFIEGLRNISVSEALKTADYSGWMKKKGSGTVCTWKSRFFILEGTRLSYFASTSDTKERGLIDITGYKAALVREQDKLVTLLATTAGKGRYCFKLKPPQPGSKKGLTFTEPRIHYFTVDTIEELKEWMAHFLKNTIDIDTSVPVISSHTTPTVSLSKAKEMVAQTRKERKLLNEGNNGENDSEDFTNKEGRKYNDNDSEEDEGRRLWEKQHNMNTVLSLSSSKLSEGRSGGKNQSVYNNNSTEDGIFSNLPTVNTAINTGVDSNNELASPYFSASSVLSLNVEHKNESPRNTSNQTKKSNDEDYFTGSAL